MTLPRKHSTAGTSNCFPPSPSLDLDLGSSLLGILNVFPLHTQKSTSTLFANRSASLDVKFCSPPAIDIFLECRIILEEISAEGQEGSSITWRGPAMSSPYCRACWMFAPLFLHLSFPNCLGLSRGEDPFSCH
ncbi:hypothetical protein BaRGS_00034553 [Batillaria attramentaria]|uniref:Uncharacterized protein n=1 Tax=Batillaria attramentaria TaxID=370345 RepID=A0ABD0JGT5_9CAEN